MVMPPLYTFSGFILEKYGNPTARIKSYWESGSRDPPLFPSLEVLLPYGHHIPGYSDVLPPTPEHTNPRNLGWSQHNW